MSSLYNLIPKNITDNNLGEEMLTPKNYFNNSNNFIENFNNTGSVDGTGICTSFFNNRHINFDISLPFLSSPISLPLASTCFSVTELGWISFDSSRAHAVITRTSNTLLKTDYISSSLKSSATTLSDYAYMPVEWTSSGFDYLASIDYKDNAAKLWSYSTDYDARRAQIINTKESVTNFVTKDVPEIGKQTYQYANEYAIDKLEKINNIYSNFKDITTTIINRGGISAGEFENFGLNSVAYVKYYISASYGFGLDFVKGMVSNIIHEPSLNHGRLYETIMGIKGEYPSVAEVGTMSGYKIGVNVVATKVFGMEVKSDPNSEKSLAEFAKAAQSATASAFGIKRGSMAVSPWKAPIEFTFGFLKIIAIKQFVIAEASIELLNTGSDILKKYADQTLHYGFNGDLTDFGSTYRKSAAGAKVGTYVSKLNKVIFPVVDKYIQTLSKFNPIKIAYDTCTTLQCKEFLITTEMQWFTRPFTYQINPKIHDKLKVIGEDIIVNRAEVLEKNLLPLEGNKACHTEDLVRSEGAFGTTWLCATNSKYVDGIRQITVQNPHQEAFTADEDTYLDNHDYTIFLQDDNSAIACHNYLVEGLYDLKCVATEI